MPFPTGWARRAPIVISSTEDVLSNFPVHLDAACFPAEALDTSSGEKAKSDGSDLRFSSDAAGATELPFEVRRWVQDASAGNRKANVYVKIPFTSVSATTTIYVWYGNASATMPAVTDANGAHAVWDNSFYGVWNLDSTSSITNSSGGSGPAGTIEGAPTTTVDSPVGLALDLDGVNDAVHFGSFNSSDCLLELVLKLDATSDQIVVGTTTSTPSPNASLSMWVQTGNPKGFFDTNGGSTYDYTFADAVIANNTTWEYWTARNRSAAGGTVVTKALPSTEVTHQAWASDGTYIYSIGGHPNNPAAPVTNNSRYDPTGDSWASRTAIPVARSGMAACYLSGKIYCMGGTTDGGTTGSSRNDIFDVAGNSWSAGAALPSTLTTGVKQGQRACTDGTYVYVLANGALERYDPVANSWVSMASGQNMGTFSSLICDGAYIYVIAGTSGSNYVVRYTIASNTWTPGYDTCPYPAGVNTWAHVCEPVGDGTWLFGFGRVGLPTESHWQLYNYNPTTQVWTKLRSYDLPMHACASGVLGGKLYVYGYWCIGDSEVYTNGHHACYNVGTGSWETSPALMEFSRNGHGSAGKIVTATLYAGAGKLYVGRQDGYGSLYSGAKVAHLRRSTSARSKAWIKATNDTLLSASSFSVVGAPADVGVSMPVLSAPSFAGRVPSVTITH